MAKQTINLGTPPGGADGDTNPAAWDKANDNFDELYAGGGRFYRVTSASYAATVTPNADTTDVLIIGTLTGNLTIANPSGTPTEFQALKIRVKQDGTGGRTVTLGNKFRLPDGVTLTWSTAAASTDIFTATYNAVDDKWDVTSLITGF